MLESRNSHAHQYAGDVGSCPGLSDVIGQVDRRERGSDVLQVGSSD